VRCAARRLRQSSGLLSAISAIYAPARDLSQAEVWHIQVEKKN
jgi:hypothetical protein